MVTPLYVATQKANLDIVNLLLQNGALVNKANLSKNHKKY